MNDGESGGGVELIVHDRVHCWAKGLLSTWWRLKEVGEAWRTRRASLIAWLLSGPLVSFVTGILFNGPLSWDRIQAVGKRSDTRVRAEEDERRRRDLPFIDEPRYG